jgi:hypothetical protein
MRALVRVGRVTAFGVLLGALLTGGVVAGVVIDPLSARRSPGPAPEALDRAHADATAGLDRAVAAANSGGGSEADEPAPGAIQLEPADIPAVAASQPSIPALPEGERFLVGAARASLSPSPGDFGGTPDQWQREGCTAIDDANLDVDHVVPSVSDLRGWPAASPDCIYLGGFGIGPTRVAKSVDEGGVWVRALAVSNGETTFAYAIADTVGWFARYDSAICDDCGIRDVRERLAADVGGLGLDGVIIGSTHTHAGADTYGGWGGIPDWYRNQIRDAAVAAVKQAVVNLEPASIAVGETHLRDRNNERRDTYYSNADSGATWLQARRADGSGIATWSTYAGHPTIVNGPVLHADWPGAAARRFEDLYGGVGLLFEGGLGNVSISGAGGASRDEDAENTGIAFANAVAGDIGANAVDLDTNVMQSSVRDITHPAMSNPGLTTLASAGFFDREFTPGTPGAGLPGAYAWSKRGQVSTGPEGNNPAAHPEQANACVSSGPTIITTAGAHRIGGFVVGFAPGEIFSNIAEVMKEKVDRSAVTMVLGQTNDALGYIIQSFEFDTAANAATEYGTQTHEYEEVFAVDRCFGDHVLQTLLETGGAVTAGL